MMKEYSWSSDVEKAKSFWSNEQYTEAEKWLKQAEQKCSDDSEEIFSLCLYLVMFYEVCLEDFARAEHYQEMTIKNLRIFKGYGDTELFGHLKGLAEIKRKLGKIEQANELEKEAKKLNR